MNVHAGFGGEGAESCISQEVITRRALTQHLALEDALIAAVRRGVDVEVLLPTVDTGDPGFQANDVPRLLAGGVHVRYLGASYVHAKLILVDSELAFIGSQNFSATSLDKYREVGVVISDVASIQVLAGTFGRGWAVGKAA